MAPTLSAGDYVWVRSRAPLPGEIVMVDHPRFGRIVKRLDEDGRLRGDGPNSTARAELGRIDDCQLIGTAVLAIRPSGIRRLRAHRRYSHRA